MGIFKKTKCRICGKEFSSFRSASHYCQSCLKKYPGLRPLSKTCHNPRCKYIDSKLEWFPSLGTHGYCRLHKYEFTSYNPVGKVDCPDHEPAELHVHEKEESDKMPKERRAEIITVCPKCGTESEEFFCRKCFAIFKSRINYEEMVARQKEVFLEQEKTRTETIKPWMKIKLEIGEYVSYGLFTPPLKEADFLTDRRIIHSKESFIGTQHWSIPYKDIAEITSRYSSLEKIQLKIRTTSGKTFLIEQPIASKYFDELISNAKEAWDRAKKNVHLLPAILYRGEFVDA